MSTRTYTSRRANILEALTVKLQDIDGSGVFLTDLQNNVHPRLKFWDEVVEFPAIFPETGNVLWPEYWSKEEFHLPSR